MSERSASTIRRQSGATNPRQLTARVKPDHKPWLHPGKRGGGHAVGDWSGYEPWLHPGKRGGDRAVGDWSGYEPWLHPGKRGGDRVAVCACAAVSSIQSPSCLWFLIA